MIKVGSDFSGVGAFNQALIRLGIEYDEVFACDMDKYARQTFIHNYGEPKYYPTNVYDREIPSEPLDIYMTSPPCQAFSLAGKRLGKEDKRGILFFNSHEFIQKNNPRYFIFENVKGLLSDNGGKTFSEWVNLLGGKSINGNPVIFPYEDAVPYHLYWQVLNAKHHGVPQNRERVFLIGIRDDKDNNFRFPVEEQLTKRLKDVLEDEVDDKYFLSAERIGTITNAERGIGWTNVDKKDTANCIVATYFKQPTDGEYLKIKSATSKGYEEATEGDSINLSVPNSETRRGRVGKGVAQTLDTGCQQGVILGYTRDAKGKVISRNIWEQAGTIHTSTGGGGNTDQFVMQYNDKSNETVFKDSIAPCLHGFEHGTNGQFNKQLLNKGLIRRLTPRECFRLMDFPDTFTWPVSDSQAYKQAGNSIVVGVLTKILSILLC